MSNFFSKSFPALTFAGAMAIGGVAFAQTTTAPTTAPTPSPSPGATSPTTRAPAAMAPSAAPVEVTGPVRASHLMKASVRNSAGDKIGDVSDLLIEPSGQVSSVILGIGGFLGIGERNVALDLGELKMMRENGNRVVLTSSMTRDGIKALPEWRDPNAAASSSTSPMPGSGSNTTRK